MNTATPELPKDKIILRGGQVVRVEDYMSWNGEPFCSTLIERRSDGSFYSAIGDPSMGVTKSGDLETVLSPLHASFRTIFSRLFDLRDPDDSSLFAVAANAGFLQERCEIVRQ